MKQPSSAWIPMADGPWLKWWTPTTLDPQQPHPTGEIHTPAKCTVYSKKEEGSAVCSAAARCTRRFTGLQRVHAVPHFDTLSSLLAQLHIHSKTIFSYPESLLLSKFYSGAQKAFFFLTKQEKEKKGESLQSRAEKNMKSIAIWHTPLSGTKGVHLIVLLCMCGCS